MNQSSSHMKDPEPEGPRKKQNDRQGDEHNPFLQSKMTATHRKTGGHASHPPAAEGGHANGEGYRRTRLILQQNYGEFQGAEIDRPA